MFKKNQSFNHCFCYDGEFIEIRFYISFDDYLFFYFVRVAVRTLSNQQLTVGPVGDMSVKIQNIRFNI